jgi:hypothetical protein
MKKRTKRLLGGIAVAAGSLGALGALVIKKNRDRKEGRQSRGAGGDVWARPGMSVTFRAELMPVANAQSERSASKSCCPAAVCYCRARVENMRRESSKKFVERYQL